MIGIPSIAFTGGGSGGHIYPGLAIIEELRSHFRGRLVWIGSTKDSDRKAVEAAGVEFFPIPSGKLRRQFSAENLADIFRVFAGYLAARKLLMQLAPALLFSKGGYVSVPPCRAAAGLGIPVFTHESDLSPGLATRLNAGVAETVFTAYAETGAALPEAFQPRVKQVGNPIRAAFASADAARGRAFLGIPDGLPLVLALGGSQGSLQINQLVASCLPDILSRACLVHQTGTANRAAAPEGLPCGERYRPMPYIGDELPDLLAAADIVVTRAGAGGLWEAGALGKALILVPLAGAGTRGDQVDNARYFESRGAASVLAGAGATPQRLSQLVLYWLDNPGEAASAGAAARGIAHPGAAKSIASSILERIGATTP
ncbi:MAG: UDP-N-acetylglucosamine--N-acetylmuramyl-(pentapeptide) pyrophosphoryl-undecaprenol N-acetylglucosamine transferase [Spirochaetota bacterium]